MRVAHKNFTGGEVSPNLLSRYDLQRYPLSAKEMTNFIPNLHGDVARRPGTYFLEDLGGDCWLIPFRFNVEQSQNFVLVFGDYTLRVANRNGWVLSEAIESPYAIEDCRDISYAQNGDVVYLAHRDYPLQKIVRGGSAGAYTWSISAVVLNQSLSAPGTPSVSWHRGSGSSDNETATLRYKITAVDDDGRESLPSTEGACTGRFPTDWVQGDYVSISWSAVTSATEYNVYREAAGTYGLIGVVRGGTSFVDQNFEPDSTSTPKEDWDPFADGNNPGSIAFHQQRMVLGGTNSEPNTFYMSRVGDFENFRKSRPQMDDDPLEFQIASGSIDSIMWIASFGAMLVGTASAEYKVMGGGEQSAITPKECYVTAQSYWGSSRMAPLIIGNSIMHCQRHGSRVRDLHYSLEKDGYTGNDLSVMAPHLIEGHEIRQWSFQQTPSSSLWCVRDDGLLLALTYMKEQEIWGWSKHKTQGSVRSLAAISGGSMDEVLMVVKRHINGADHYFLERMEQPFGQDDAIEDAFYVDCGLKGEFQTAISTVSGLSHLEGCTVDALCDGSPEVGLVVKNGAVELQYPAKKVVIGLPYTSTLAPMPVEADAQSGSTLGLRRGYGQCSIRMFRTVGGQFGCSKDNLYDFPFVPANWGEACVPFSGDIECTPGGGQDTDTTIYIVQARPLPMQIVSVTETVDFGQQG